MRRVSRGVAAFAVAVALVIDGPARHAAGAIGPYTYPFYTNRTITSDYGPSSFEVYSSGHGYPHWHGGIDWAMPIGTQLAATREGTIRNHKEDLQDGQVGPFGTGNHVYVEHTKTRFSLYYHLTKNGVLYASGTAVSAGQNIALSGDTGVSSGPHLHYSLMTSGTCVSNSCDVDPHQWTTNPGRVPYRASLVATSSNGGVVWIEAGTTVTFWVKFKNTGGRTWSNVNDANGKGRLVMYPTDATGLNAGDSPFAAADWELMSSVGTMDQASVAPDGTATFTFGLKGATAGNLTDAYFNLRAFGLTWFNHAVIDNFSIPIQVWEDCTPCP